MSLLVYVTAPFEDAAIVRELVHPKLVDLGLHPTARWAEHAQSKEDFARYAPAQLRTFAEHNDSDLRGSDVCLVMARHGAGGEMFAEARVALEWRKPVVWVGHRRTLSSWRKGVVRIETMDEAIAVLKRMVVAHSDGIRGEMLAHLAGAAA